MRIVLTKKKVWDVVKEYAVISFGILLVAIGVFFLPNFPIIFPPAV